MDKVDQYRQVFLSFKELCSHGKQPSSFSQFCKNNGVHQNQMRHYLKDDYVPLKSLPGYGQIRSAGISSLLYAQVYEEFKELCAQGNQPGTFKDYCSKYGISKNHMHKYLNNRGLRVDGLPGYTWLGGAGKRKKQCQEIPFEDIVFEECGFVPLDGRSAIAIKVDDHIEISFSADTDIDVIVKCVQKIRKEVCHVGD